MFRESKNARNKCRPLGISRTPHTARNRSGRRADNKYLLWHTEIKSYNDQKNNDDDDDVFR